MKSIDGYQVYKMLKDSYLLNGIPFVFLKQNATIEDVRQGMNHGADDFLRKPVSIYDLVTSIEIQLQKSKSNKSESTRDFNTLFQLSPNGIIVFNEHAVFKANKSIVTLLKIDKQKSNTIRLEDLFEPLSLSRIKSWIQQSNKDGNTVFNDTIAIKNVLGEELKMDLVISEFSRHSEFVQFIGFFTPVSSGNNHLVNDQLASQVCNMLKREKITFTNDLEEKITHIIKQRTIRYNKQNNSFFTMRENQVLSLSMEGMPIKMIAEKLAISTRTVEKHRTKLIEKSGANNIVEVIVFSLKNGLIKI
jgi:DNA-binding NarL/FixJ family response regulator